MKLTHGVLSTLLAAGTFAGIAAHAGSVTVLEGFENGYQTNSQGHTNIEVFTTYGTPRGGPVTISLYTSAGAGDPRVTQGTHSAKVVFPTDGFGNDFALNLSDLACSMIENAASSNQPARYILRYDVILENVNQLSYFNQHFFLGNAWDYVRSGGGIVTNYGGKQFEIDSYSCALELPGNGIPTNAPNGHNSADFTSAGITGLTGFLSDQFGGITEPLNNFTIYIDNIRLIDTYESPTTTPAVYSVKSFEGAGALIGTSNGAPANVSLSIYTTNHQYNMTADQGIAGVCALGAYNFIYMDSQAQEENDFAVTDGTNCLDITNKVAGYSYDIVSIPLTGTRLTQLLSLNLTPAQLAHYTIRWDLTTPYCPVLNNALDGDYFQVDYNATGGSILPMSNGRRQSDGQYGLQRQTYSMTLDQMLYWGPAPALSLSTSISGNWASDPFYIDNFRIINTAPKYTLITAQNYDPNTHQFTVTWLSEPSQHYTIQYTTNLAAGFTGVLANNIPSGGDTTTKTVTVSGNNAVFARILTQ